MTLAKYFFKPNLFDDGWLDRTAQMLLVFILLFGESHERVAQFLPPLLTFLLTPDEVVGLG